MRAGHVVMTAVALLALLSEAGMAQPSPATPDGEIVALAPGDLASGPRRDPFRPFTLDIHPGETRVPLTPLQRFELGQLTVVGTIWAVNPPRAMVEDSAGMGYIVTVGTLIGRHGGVVTGIEPQRVVVEERVLDFYGNEQVNRVVMETPKEDPTAKGK